MNEYIKKIDDAARDSLRRMATAQRGLKRAEKLMKDASGSHDERRVLNAKSYLLDAQEEVKKARKNAEAALDGLSGIRAEVVRKAVVASAMNPDDVDNNALEIMKSGICRPADFDFLARKYSGNATMTRLIGKFAAEAANGEKDDPTARSAFFTVATRANEAVDPTAGTADVDLMLDVFKRCINNVNLIERYDELTVPVTGITPGNPLTGSLSESE